MNPVEASAPSGRGTASAARAQHPLRVGHLLDGSMFGFGVFEMTRTLLQGLDRSQVTPIGLFLGPGAERDALAPLCDEPVDLNVGNLLPLSQPGRGRFYLPNLVRKSGRIVRAIGALALAIRRHHLDLVHVHSHPLHIVGGLAARLASRPCLWHWHGVVRWSAPTRCVVALAQRHLATRIACISGFVQSHLPTAVQPKSRVVYNGVPIETIRSAQRRGALRRKAGTPPEAPLVGIFGALTPYKGHECFLQAAAEVVNEFPAAWFIVVGSESEVQRRRYHREDTLRALAHKLGISHRVVFAGYVSDARLYMADCDVVCMPTIPDRIAGEGFGLVAVEAMAAGVATVLTNCGAAPELATHEHSSLLVPPRDPGALAAAIKQLLRDDDYRHRIAATGHRDAAQRFDVSHMLRAIEALYRECAERRTPAKDGTVWERR